MKNLPFSIFLFLFGTLIAQNPSQVYVLEIETAYSGLEILDIQPVSEGEGYNNQPSFKDNNVILYAGNNGGQSDIAQYNLSSKTRSWFNSETPNGGEYSPQKFPSNNNVAAVRLDKDGLQRLYSYNFETKKPSLLFENIQVAYFAFYNDNQLLATVLSGGNMDLVTLNISEKKVDTLLTNVGRSLQKVPNSDLMSYSIFNEDKNLDLYLYDIQTTESFFVCELPIGIQDYVWKNDTQILVGSGTKLWMYDTLGDGEWKEAVSVEEFNIKNINRMAISPDGKKLAVVAEKIK